MLIIPGSVALSNFRRNKLLASLQALVTAITAIQASYVHFVRSTRELTESEQTQLKTILDYGEEQGAGLPVGSLFLVTPRPGTISPWSSKATDIVHNCGLAVVERVERGLAYGIEASSTLTYAEQAQISQALHDRMTETVLTDYQDAVVLFSQAEPAVLRYVDISGDAREALAHANQEWGLALSVDEIDYLAANYAELGRNPTDVELMMFAQANS